MRLNLDYNETQALATAIDNYLNGLGMNDSDEDEPVLEQILRTLEGN